MSREQAKAQQTARFKRLARKSAARVDALLHAVTLAQLGGELDVVALRDVLVAEVESALYHAARAEGGSHQEALDKSREGRQQVDTLAGWT